MNKFGRIIAGKYKGKKFPLPNDSSIRPTTDRVKESIFNILQHNYKNNIVDGYVLDLFAGSGALGLECVSRGAKSVTFVDKNKNAIDNIKSIIDSLSCHINVFYIKADSLKLELSKLNINFSLVFLDPPYETDLVKESLSLIINQNIFNKDCIFVIESSKDLNIDYLELKQIKALGSAIIKIYQLK